jgi:acid stress-induced BolA-like protein IbaG/YrbA
MELEKRILDILKASGVHIFHSDFELTASGNIGGILSSNDFQGLDEISRQELVWGKLKSKLTEDESRHIVSLITVTPEEEQMFKQEA